MLLGQGGGGITKLVRCPVMGRKALLQLGVFRFGLFQDGNFGVGVFPEGEEVLVCGLSFGGVAGEGIGTGQAQVRQCADWLVQDDAWMVENFLELGCGCAALVRSHIRFATQVNGVESEAQVLSSSTKFIGGSRGKRVNCLGGAACLKASRRLTFKRQLLNLAKRFFKILLDGLIAALSPSKLEPEFAPVTRWRKSVLQCCAILHILVTTPESLYIP
jgi:hypothetical protein